MATTAFDTMYVTKDGKFDRKLVTAATYDEVHMHIFQELRGVKILRCVGPLQKED